MRKHFLKVMALAVIATLSACSTQFLQPMNDEVDRYKGETDQYLEQIKRDNTNIRVQTRANVEYKTDIWIPVKKAHEVDAEITKKGIVSRKIAINREFKDLLEISQVITRLTGVPVSVSQDVTQTKFGQAEKKPADGTTNPATPIPSIPSFPSKGGIALPAASNSAISLSYDGELAGFLDMAAARYGVSWEWTGKDIHFFRFQTKTFRVVALPGDTNTQQTISNTTGNTDDNGSSNSTGTTFGSSSSATGGSSSTSAVTITGLSVWVAFEESIKTMLSPDGSVVVTPATGTVTVTDTPQIISRVSKFIDQQNESLAKRVHINVRVVSVELNDTEAYGINWNLLYNSINGRLGAGLASKWASGVDTTDLTFKILPGNSPNAWNGSNVILSALSGQGRVSNLTSASVTTMNNQPTPLQVGRQLAYLQSSQTNVTDSAGVTNSLQPGMINTGFTMNLIPHVLDKGKLVLQFSIDISSLVSLESVTSGESTIQTPEIDTRNFMQRVPMNSGDTLILTGFEQGIASADSEGVGSARNPLFGGGIKGKKSNSIIVILIQATSGN